MLLINREGPGQFHQLFFRVSRKDMSDALQSESIGVINIDSYDDNHLLLLYIDHVYSELTAHVNHALFVHANNAIGDGKVRVVYSPLGDGWVRGNRLSPPIQRWVEETVDKAEQQFAAKILEPYPDLARQFNENVF